MTKITTSVALQQSGAARARSGRMEALAGSRRVGRQHPRQGEPAGEAGRSQGLSDGLTLGVGGLPGPQTDLPEWRREEGDVLWGRAGSPTLISGWNWTCSEDSGQLRERVGRRVSVISLI